MRASVPSSTGAFDLNFGFFRGLGQGTAQVPCLFLGYYQVCYLGAEIKRPAAPFPAP